MVTDVSREDVQRLLGERAQLVDVRPTPEYENEHISGAISLPLKTLDGETASRVLDRDRPVVVY